MTEHHFKFQSILSSMDSVRLSRRHILKTSLALGVGGALLAACADDDTDDDAPAADPDDDSEDAEAEPEDDTSDDDVVADDAEDAEEDEDDDEAPAGEGEYGGELVVALSGEMLTLDMHEVSATNLNLVGWHIYETLFTWDDEYAVIPMLAESHEVSDDGMTHNIALRQGVMFHNGEEMTADDVVASLERWSENYGFAQELLGAVDEMNQPDDYSLELILNRPVGTMAAGLAQTGRGPAIYPASVVAESTVDDLAEYIGTGPYKFVEWDRASHLILERFDDYAALEGEPNGYGGHKYAYIDQMRFTPVPDESARQAGLSTGEYHFLETVPSDLFETMENDPEIITELLPPIAWSVFIINMNSPITGNETIRKAIQAALDMEPILQSGFGDGFFRLDPGLMSQETVWHSTAGEEYYNMADPDLARELLEEAGYDGEPLVWTATQEYADHYNRTFVAVQQLEAVGFNIDFQVKDWATILQEQSDDTIWEITTTGTTLRPDPGSLFLLNVCDVAGWWCDEETIDLMEQLRSESDFDARYEIFEQVQTNVYEQVPFIKNGDTMALTARHHTVHNLSPLLMIGPILWNCWIEQ
jgi:peptide/nickel transport system substrate-binding protein